MSILDTVKKFFDDYGFLVPAGAGLINAIGSRDIPENITTTNVPWSGVQPTIAAGQNLALNNTTDFQPYMGQRVAGFTPDQLSAMGKVAGFAPEQEAAMGKVAGFAPEQEAAMGKVAGFAPEQEAAMGKVAGFAPEQEAAMGKVAGLTPEQEAAMARARNLSFSPEQQMALGQLAQRSFGTPLESAAQNMATRTLQGDYLNPATNQPLQNMLDYTTRNVVRNYGGLLGRNFGNAGVLQNMAEDIGRGTAGVYQTERAMQPQMAAQAPQLAGMDYTNIGNLMDAGNMRQNLEREQIGALMNEGGMRQNLGQQQLQALMHAGGMRQNLAQQQLQALMDAGGMRQNLAQQQLQALMDAGGMRQNLAQQQLQATMDAGNMHQNLAQQQLMTPWAQHLEQQQAPYNRLQLLQNAASMGTGYSSQTAPNPNQQNPFAAFLSGALGAGGVMAQMGQRP